MKQNQISILNPHKINKHDKLTQKLKRQNKNNKIDYNQPKIILKYQT